MAELLELPFEDFIQALREDPSLRDDIAARIELLTQDRDGWRERAQKTDVALDAAEAVVMWHDLDRTDPGVVTGEDRIVAVERYFQAKAALVFSPAPGSGEKGRGE